MTGEVYFAIFWTIIMFAATTATAGMAQQIYYKEGEKVWGCIFALMSLPLFLLYVDSLQMLLSALGLK